jgi:hypothetical protein
MDRTTVAAIYHELGVLPGFPTEQPTLVLILLGAQTGVRVARGAERSLPAHPCFVIADGSNVAIKATLPVGGGNCPRGV